MLLFYPAVSRRIAPTEYNSAEKAGGLQYRRGEISPPVI